MSSLVIYSTVVGGFYIKSEAFEKAISIAKSHVGDDVWKRSYSGADPAGATAVAKKELREAGVDPLQLEGQLTNVSFAENSDSSGNTYPKLQLGMKMGDKDLLVSLDLKSDVAQQLISKLYNCKIGDTIRISGWPTTVERGERTFINHALSVKDSGGTEVPVNPFISVELKKQTSGVEASLIAAGIDDKKVINAAKTNKRIAVYKDLLLKLETQLKNIIS